MQIHDVAGPELEEEDNMSEVSDRSSEQAIIINKSLHLSPKPAAGKDASFYFF